MSESTAQPAHDTLEKVSALRAAITTLEEQIAILTTPPVQPTVQTQVIAGDTAAPGHKLCEVAHTAIQNEAGDWVCKDCGWKA